MTPPAEKIVFASPRWIAVLYYALSFMEFGLSAMVLWLLAPTWTAFDTFFGIVFLFVPLLGVGIMILLHAQRVAGSRIELDSDGVTLRLPGYGGWMYMQKVAENRYAWSDIRSVGRRRRIYGAAMVATDLTEYVIKAGQDTHVLTRTFIRDPRTAAEAIAAAAGRQLQDLGFQRRGLPSKD